MSAVRGGWRRCAAGGRGRWRHDLSILGVGQSNPLPMAHLEGSICRNARSAVGLKPSCAASCPRRPAMRVSWSVVALGRPRSSTGAAPTPCKSTNLTKRAPYAYKSDAKCGPSSQVACFRIFRRTRRTRSSRFRTACDGLRGVAGGSSVAVASLTTSPVQPVARLSAAAAPRASRVWPQPSLYAALLFVFVPGSRFNTRTLPRSLGSQPDSRTRRPLRPCLRRCGT
jgi:hypothetical protein